MQFLGCLVFACSILGIVYASALCSYETMKCNPLYPRMGTLYFSSRNFARLCKFQKSFFSCIRNVSSTVCNGEFHPVLLRSELLFAELCDKNSTFFKIYERSIRCIESYGYDQCYRSAKDPKEMNREEYCKYKKDGFDCVSDMIRAHCKKILPKGLDIIKILESMQIEEPHLCYTPADLELFSQLENGPGEFSSDGADRRTAGIQRTGDVPSRRNPSVYKPELVYTIEDSSLDIPVKPELDILHHENADIYKDGAYVYSEPSVTWRKRSARSPVPVTASPPSFLNYLERATKASDPLHELENIISDYVEEFAKQID